jgi:hypothetical protein
MLALESCAKLGSPGLAGALVRSLFAGLLRQDKRMAVFTAFSDECGAGAPPGEIPQGAYIIGGFVAAKSVWGNFAQSWHDRVLAASPRIPYLHMNEIRGSAFREKYKLTADDADAKVETATTLLSQFGGLDPGRPLLHAVMSLINRKDLHDMVALVQAQGHKIQRGTLDLPDYLCFLGYIQTVLNFTPQLFPDTERIDFVVARNGKVTKHFESYTNALRFKFNRPELVGGLIPANPEDRNPLQMADVLLWHTMHYHEDGAESADFLRLAKARCFKHLWRRGELEEFTQGLIDGLNSES